MMQYQKRNVFGRKLSNYLSSIMMKQDDLQEMTRAFKELDTNHNGLLSLEEFTEGM